MKKEKCVAATRQSTANQMKSMRRSADAPLQTPSVRHFFLEAEILFRPRVWLKNCPPGFFWFEGDMGFKTEYEHNGIEVFNAAGEIFWGGAGTKTDRDRLLVNPVKIELRRPTISSSRPTKTKQNKSCSTCKPAPPVVAPPAAGINQQPLPP